MAFLVSCLHTRKWVIDTTTNLLFIIKKQKSTFDRSLFIQDVFLLSKMRRKNFLCSSSCLLSPNGKRNWDLRRRSGQFHRVRPNSEDNRSASDIVGEFLPLRWSVVGNRSPLRIVEGFLDWSSFCICSNCHSNFVRVRLDLFGKLFDFRRWSEVEKQKETKSERTVGSSSSFLWFSFRLDFLARFIGRIFSFCCSPGGKLSLRSKEKGNKTEKKIFSPTVSLRKYLLIC